MFELSYSTSGFEDLRSLPAAARNDFTAPKTGRHLLQSSTITVLPVVPVVHRTPVQLGKTA